MKPPCPRNFSTRIRRRRGKGQEGWAGGVRCSKAINESEITRSFRVFENLQNKEEVKEDRNTRDSRSLPAILYPLG